MLFNLYIKSNHGEGNKEKETVVDYLWHSLTEK